MKMSDFFRIGFINLWRRKTRTALTALSMTIGVMCIIVLISIGIGFEQAYRENVESMGSLTKIDVTPPSETIRKQKTALLNDRAVGAFGKLNGVEAVTPVVQSAAYLKSGKYVNMVKLYGINLATAESFLLVPTQGELPSAGLRMRPELMLTDDVGEGFADPAKDWEVAADAQGHPLIDPLHSNIKLTFDYSNLTGSQKEGEDGRAVPGGIFYPLRATGICSSLNHTFSTSAFLDRERLEEWMEANKSFVNTKSEERKEQEKATGKIYDLVWVKVKDVNNVQNVAKVIQDAGFSTYSLNDMLESVRKQSRQIQGMLGAIGAVAMLVSAICVANTMMMSINERTREVGVLKVLGTELADITMLFLAEALIVGLLGGLTGLALSYILRGLIPVFFGGMDVRSVIPFWLAIVGVLFSGVVALLSALLPAVKAMKISPNEAIRAE
ncbi:ABC transporter permease [Oscillospiraceae bacterium PP1C4]